MTKDQIRHAAHFTDAAERSLQLALVTFHAETLFLGQTFKAVSICSSIDLRRLDDLETVCQLVSVPPSQRWFM